MKQKMQATPGYLFTTGHRPAIMLLNGINLVLKKQLSWANCDALYSS